MFTVQHSCPYKISNFLQKATKYSSAVATLLSEIIQEKSKVQAHTYNSQQCKFSSGMIPFKAIAE